MQVVADAFGPCDLPSPAVVTVGNYDGIHRGQRSVLERVTARSRALGLRVFKDGRRAVTYTSDLRDQPLAAFVKESVALAALRSGDAPWP